MRIALVSPYSWTYPGGVLRHIEALAVQFQSAGHDVRILAPHDPDDALSARLHRGVRPQAREVPDELVSLGRTVGLPANGAVSNLALSPESVFRLRSELREGGYDVAHLHEPIAPIVGWDALASAPVPLVGTFHAYSTSLLFNHGATLAGARRRFNRLGVRIAVSEAAAWTGRRFFGGEYRIIPNGVLVDPAHQAAPAGSGPLRIVFVGAAVERKGLPVLLRAFEALREHVPATLTVIGTSSEQIAPMLLDDRGVRALGKVSDEEKTRVLREADVLCAPSLGGESFGMVLTEAFAAATPVVASNIAGYGDVVRDGIDGLLVPRGDPQALAQALLDLAHDPARRQAMALAARQRAERFSWTRIAGEVLAAYEDAIALPRPEGAVGEWSARLGLRAADGRPVAPASRLASLEPAPATRARRVLAGGRRVVTVAFALGALVLCGVGAQQAGVGHILASLLSSRPVWVLAAVALMCGAMSLRGLAWQAILRAADLPRRVRAGDALRGTFIGVLMSATLPARLGEPSRALILARRLGRTRETLPVVFGTVVSQALLNIAVLAVLGAVTFSSADILDFHNRALLITSFAPLGVLLWIGLAPALLPPGPRSRRERLAVVWAGVRRSLASVRRGMGVFHHPRMGPLAVAAQLVAWTLQLGSCYVLLHALGLDAATDLATAAGVLFAVNLTAVVPATPSNIGIFQAACVAVLHGGWHVGTAPALAYGIILQAVELATAVIMGGPALVAEGLSWKDVRLRAMQAAPVHLDLPVDPASEAEGAF